MNIYSESEVILMAGEDALKAWKENIIKSPGNPRILKKDDIVILCYYEGMDPWPGTIIRTHITGYHVTYDLDVTFPNGETERMYNQQAAYVKEVLFVDCKSRDEVVFTENK